MNTLILNGKEVEEVLTIELAYEAAEAAYKAYGSGNVIQPPIVSIDVQKYNGELDIKSGCTLSADVIGVKLASGYWNNPSSYNLPSLLAMITLFDAKTGYPLCILNGGKVTYYRTAAAGAYAANLLANSESSKLALIGAGGLAEMHFEATMRYFAIKNVSVYGVDREQVHSLISRKTSKYPNVIFEECKTAEEAVNNADIIATATPSRQAIIRNGWIKPGAHINAFGADMEGKKELEEELVANCKMVGDCIEECIKRGELQHVIKSGLCRREDIYGEIGEIALGQKKGRVSKKEITLFDSTGMSIQDIITTLKIYEEAKKRGLGREISLM